MKRLIILALTLTVGLSACDVLDLEPKDRVTQFDYFKTANDLELFSNPFYNNLLDKEPFDEQSDLLVQNTLSAILFGGSHRTVPESGGGWSWTDLRRMNTLLEYADMCEDKEAVTKYTAVTRFFRAFFYFEKVKRFGDVPWYDIQLGSADELLYKPRDSRELILTKMLEDIDYAINSGGLTESAADPYHVNKWAALALKAQFCLYEGTYRKYHNLNLDGHDANFYLDLAAKAALEIIEKGPYKLYQTGHPEKDYLTLFAQKDASPEEYILAIKFDYAIGARHNASAYTLLPTQGRPGLTRKFINTYLMDNGTGLHRQTRLAGDAVHRRDGRPRPASGAEHPHSGLHANRTDRSRRADVRNYRHRLPARQVRTGPHVQQQQQRPCGLFGLRYARLPLRRSAVDLCRSQGRTGHAHAGRPHDLHQQT